MPKKLPETIDNYYNQAAGSSNELRELYLYLLGDNKDIPPVVRGCEIRKGRLEKLNLLLPKSFMKKLESKNLGYLSQFMICDRNAHTIHADFHQQMQYKADALLNEMDKLSRDLLYDKETEKFDKDALKTLLFDEFCESKESLKNMAPKANPYRRRMEFYFDLDPAMALSRMVLYLCLGPYATQNLDRILPSNASMSQVSSALPSGNDPEAQKAYADYLYDEGSFKEAFTVYESIAGQLKDGGVYYKMARMYENGNGCAKDYLRAFQYYKKSAERNAADGYYGLFKCYLNGIGESADALQARNCLEKAYELGSRLAARDMGTAYYSGNAQMQYEKNPELAKKYFLAGTSGNSCDDAALTCLYMLGVCYEKHGTGADDRLTARNYYMKAAWYGHFSAQERLLDMGWLDVPGESSEAAPNTAEDPAQTRLCYFNCDPDEAMSLPDSVLTERYDVCFGKLSDFLTARLNLSDVQTMMDAGPDGKILFYFFHSSEVKNRNDACELLEYLKSMTQNHPELSGWLSGSVRIFLRSTDTLTTTLIDSMISSLRNTYFQVRICDPHKDASEWLLANIPLFLPNLKDSRKNWINVTILGDGPCVPWLIRNAVSVCHTNFPFTLSVISSDIKKLKRSLQKECPGIFKYQRLIKAKLNFVEYDPDDPEIGDMLSHSFHSDDPTTDSLGDLLRKTDYFIISSDDSTHNLEQAMQLREWCLKNDPTFSRFPIIAAYCPDSRLSWQSQKFTVGNAPIGYQWYNNYDIRCFGSFTDLYSAFNLTDGLLERRALETHLSYYGDLSDEKARHGALNSYYSRHYNRDSSRCSAINLIYRAFAVDIHLDNGISYGIAQNERKLAESYETWLTGATRDDHEKLMLAARLEHERWCNYMLSRGWMPASVNQMAVYMQRGNPGHQFYLAKLHPYICSWEELGDDTGGVQYYLNQTLKTLNPDTKPKRLKEMNVENVKTSAKLFRI